MKIVSEIVEDLTPEEKIKSALTAAKMVFTLVEKHPLNEDGRYSRVIRLFDEFLNINKSIEEYEADPEDMSDEFIYFIRFDLDVEESDDFSTKQAYTALFALEAAYKLTTSVYMFQSLFLLEDESQLNEYEKIEKEEAYTLETVISFAALAETMAVSSIEDVERIHNYNVTESEEKVIRSFIENWRTRIKKN